jgi:hypothetical protein
MPPVLGPRSPSKHGLVVLGRRERAHGPAIGQREDGDLFTLEVLLHHHARAGVAEHAPLEHVVDGATGLGGIGAQDGALAGREAIRLDHRPPPSSARTRAPPPDPRRCRSAPSGCRAARRDPWRTPWSSPAPPRRAWAEGQRALGRERIDEPERQGPFGPTTVRSIAPRLTRSAIAGTSSARTGTHSATRAIPGFPGAAYSAPSLGLRDSFQASACSRPPPPTRRTRRPLTSPRRSPRPGRSPPSGCRGRARGIGSSGAAPTFRPLPARAPMPD